MRHDGMCAQGVTRVTGHRLGMGDALCKRKRIREHCWIAWIADNRFAQDRVKYELRRNGRLSLSDVSYKSELVRSQVNFSRHTSDGKFRLKTLLTLFVLADFPTLGRFPLNL